MRRFLSLSVAGALVVGLSVVSMAPVQAAPRPAPIATGFSGSAIIEVGERWENFHGDRHNAFRDDGWNNNWRHRQRWRHSRWDRNWRHQRHRRHYGQFYFGFPFAFVHPHYR